MEISIDQVIVGAVSLLLGYVSTQGAKLLNNKAKEVLSKIKYENVVVTLLRVGELIQDVVEYLNGTMVNDLKAASADGKLTVEEQKAIFNMAKERITNMITVEMYSILGSIVNDVDLWIENKIEQSVASSKK